MRVLFFLSAREWSGSARAFTDAAAGLAARGVSVTAVCPPESAAEERLSSAGLEVVTLPTDGWWLGVAWRLAQVLRERFIEVTLAQSAREHLIAAMASRLAGRAAVVRRTPAGARLVPDPATRAAMRLAASGFVFTSVGEMQSAPPMRNALEPAIADVGIDAEQYDAVRPATRAMPAAGDGGPSRLIVCVHDTADRARAATILRTMAMLAPRHPELRLALLGPGSDAEHVRMHAAALRLTGLVSHLGERDDYLAVLRAAAIGWVAADHDGGAYGALDLMALRIPVLAERGSIVHRYVADGITGMLLPAGDTPAGAAAIAALLAHDEQRSKMGDAGRQRAAREFDRTAMIDGFERAVQAARDRTRWRM
jgi:glycosyltransferase involved in cell wall biosynthesis